MRHPNWIHRILLTPIAAIFLLAIQNCTPTGSGLGSAAAFSKAENEIQDVRDVVVDVPRTPGENEGGEPPVGGGGEPSPGGENPPPSGGGEARTETEIILDVIERNEACSVDEPALNMNGKNYAFNGKQDLVSVGNAGTVTVNGRTGKLSVMGAEAVHVNGKHDQVCLQANAFFLNGVYGRAGYPTVLQGQGPDASVGAINGVQDSDLAVVGVQHVGAINGTGGDIYLYGGEVEVINGNARNVYVMNGAVVKRMNGRFTNVYVYSGSSVGTSNGRVNIVPR